MKQPINQPPITQQPTSQTPVTPVGNQSKLPLIILIALLFLLLGAGAMFAWQNWPEINPLKPKEVGCTLEAKICPDGLSVGRVPPNCDFAICPSISPVAQPTQSPNTQIPTDESIKEEFYVKGEVVVGFKKGTIYSDAKHLLDSYNLRYKEPYKRLDFENKKEIPYEPSDVIDEKPVFFVVYVPIGEEQKWVEIIAKNNLVEYTQLNHYVTSFSP